MTSNRGTLYTTPGVTQQRFESLLAKNYIGIGQIVGEELTNENIKDTKQTYQQQGTNIILFRYKVRLCTKLDDTIPNDQCIFAFGQNNGPSGKGGFYFGNWRYPDGEFVEVYQHPVTGLYYIDNSVPVGVGVTLTQNRNGTQGCQPLSGYKPGSPTFQVSLANQRGGSGRPVNEISPPHTPDSCKWDELYLNMPTIELKTPCEPASAAAIPSSISNLLRDVQNLRTGLLGNDSFLVTSQNFVNEVQSKVDGVASQISGIVAWLIQEIKKQILRLINTTVNNTIGAVYLNTRYQIFEGVDAGTKAINCVFEALLNLIAQFIADALNNLINDILSPTTCAIENFLAELLSQIVNGILSAISGILAGISGIIGAAINVIDTILGVVEALLNLFEGCPPRQICPVDKEWNFLEGVAGGGSFLDIQGIFDRVNSSISSFQNLGQAVTDFTSALDNLDFNLNIDNAIAAANGCFVGPSPCGPPTVRFFGGGAVRDAIGRAVVSSTGSVIGINITDPGFGYSSSPMVVINDPCGTGVGARGFADIGPVSVPDTTIPPGGGPRPRDIGPGSATPPGGSPGGPGGVPDGPGTLPLGGPGETPGLPGIPGGAPPGAPNVPGVPSTPTGGPGTGIPGGGPGTSVPTGGPGGTTPLNPPGVPGGSIPPGTPGGLGSNPNVPTGPGTPTGGPGTGIPGGGPGTSVPTGGPGGTTPLNPPGVPGGSIPPGTPGGPGVPSAPSFPGDSGGIPGTPGVVPPTPGTPGTGIPGTPGTGIPGTPGTGIPGTPGGPTVQPVIECSYPANKGYKGPGIYLDLTDTSEEVDVFFSVSVLNPANNYTVTIPNVGTIDQNSNNFSVNLPGGKIYGPCTFTGGTLYVGNTLIRQIQNSGTLPDTSIVISGTGQRWDNFVVRVGRGKFVDLVDCNSSYVPTVGVTTVIIPSGGFNYLPSPNGSLGSNGTVYADRCQTVVQRANGRWDPPYNPGDVIRLESSDRITLPGKGVIEVGDAVLHPELNKIGGFIVSVNPPLATVPYKSMIGFNDSPGTEPNASGWFSMDDYNEAKEQGFSDSDIRFYLEKNYTGKLSPKIQSFLNDPTWGRLTTGPVGYYGIRQMFGFDDGAGLTNGDYDSSFTTGNGFFGYVDYEEARRRGYTDADIRYYLENHYTGRIGDRIKRLLEDPKFGKVQGISNMSGVVLTTPKDMRDFSDRYGVLGSFGNADYDEARRQGYSDADIRFYLENYYTGTIGARIRVKLNDPAWGRIPRERSFSDSPGGVGTFGQADVEQARRQDESDQIFLASGKLYEQAVQQGYTDADIRYYLENYYKGEISPEMKARLDDPNWGRELPVIGGPDRPAPPSIKSMIGFKDTAGRQDEFSTADITEARKQGFRDVDIRYYLENNYDGFVANSVRRLLSDPNWGRLGQTITVSVTAPGCPDEPVIEEYISDSDDVISYLDDIIIVDPGFGYDPNDPITITPPNGAEVQVEYTNGSVSDVIVTNPGSGFTELPTITINTDTGYNARIIPVLKFIKVNPDIIGTGTRPDFDRDLLDNQGNIIGRTSRNNILDPQGNTIGSIVNGNIVDRNGNIITDVTISATPIRIVDCVGTIPPIRQFDIVPE